MKKHQLNKVRFLCLILLPTIVGMITASAGCAAEQAKLLPITKGVINKNLAKIVYSGGESFKYDVAWSGGIKIGEIYLQVRATDSCEDCYEIDSTITTNGGIIDALYPVRDKQITKVRGDERLPYFCETWQKEGRNYTAHKQIIYNQKSHWIKKMKEGDTPQLFQLDGVVHNEFSSFFSSRVMQLDVDKPITVPTFGDDKRCEVVVKTLAETKLEETLFGPVSTLKVTPILTFSGLYDKRGDTVIWYTNDECRVPVQIQSRLVIGSLTATLVNYQNPKCNRYHNLISRN